MPILTPAPVPPTDSTVDFHRNVRKSNLVHNCKGAALRLFPTKSSASCEKPRFVCVHRVAALSALRGGCCGSCCRSSY
eukprot:6203841-Pleurochrysis_carterae.AAC.4